MGSKKVKSAPKLCIAITSSPLSLTSIFRVLCFSVKVCTLNGVETDIGFPTFTDGNIQYSLVHIGSMSEPDSLMLFLFTHFGILIDRGMGFLVKGLPCLKDMVM